MGRKNVERESYSIEELDRVLAVISRRCPTGIRNRALIMIGSRAGLRCQELLDLTPKDICDENGKPYVWIRHGKGDKSRRVPIKGNVLDTIHLWLDARRKIGLNGRHPLFCTITDSKDGTLKKGSPMKTAYVRALFIRLGKKAGLEKRFHPHGLRHTAAVQWHNRGIALGIIQKMLGHSSLNTTAIYLATLTAKDAIDAVDAIEEW